MEDAESSELPGEERRRLMLETVQKYHDGQYRSNKGIPYWHHCRGVSEILENVFGETGEIDDENLKDDIVIASMGHDLLEDTIIEPDEIEEKFGGRVKGFVEYMTNYRGDSDRGEYVEKIRHAPEEVKLIKLADMAENCSSVADSAKELGDRWITGFFLPIIEEMKPVIRSEDFRKYPKTASRLVQRVESAYRMVYNALEKLNS